MVILYSSTTTCDSQFVACVHANGNKIKVIHRMGKWGTKSYTDCHIKEVDTLIEGIKAYGNMAYVLYAAKDGSK